MPNHNFNFPGGDRLSKIGASWFVSYSYCCHINQQHRNWDNNGLIYGSRKSRISKFAGTTSYHQDWLQEVLSMGGNKLNTNKIGLTSVQVKNMAGALLQLPLPQLLTPTLQSATP